MQQAGKKERHTSDSPLDQRRSISLNVGRGEAHTAEESRMASRLSVEEKSMLTVI